MAKSKDLTARGTVGFIRRKCLVCGERWDAPHPNDPNTLFCPDCTKLLRIAINKAKEAE